MSTSKKIYTTLVCTDCSKKEVVKTYDEYCEKYFGEWSGCDFCQRSTGKRHDLCSDCKFCPKSDYTYCKFHRKQNWCDTCEQRTWKCDKDDDDLCIKPGECVECRDKFLPESLKFFDKKLNEGVCFSCLEEEYIEDSKYN